MTDLPRIDALVTRQAVAAPDHPAIVADGHSLSYGALDAAITEAADLLRAGGARPGDRVLLIVENCAATAVLILAASRIGAFAVPVNARMTGAEIGRIRDHATPRLTLWSSQISPEAARHAAEAGARPIITSFGALHVSEMAETATTPDAETAVILYTTGTTGAPKGVMLTHDNLIFAGRTSADLRGMVATDRVYGVLPMTHVFGLASMLIASISVGATAQIETRFRPDLVLRALQDGATVFPAVPQMHALLMQYAQDQGLSRLKGSRLRYVSAGAAPLDPAWKARAESFYGIALQNGYGMTESTAGICGTRNPIGVADVSVGPPLPGIEVMLDSATGSQGDADVGEILTRGPHVMKGYYRNAEATAAAIDVDRWLHTGDLGRFDSAGNLHVVGRSKELIIRSGFNVYPPEVEAALNDHPDVIQSAVIGRRVEGGNEEILAFVQCLDPARVDPDALRAFVAARLTSYKRPARIILTTALPAAATGKILKHRLLESFADQLAGPAD